MERRLAAIVSTDIVGYSRLMGADEAGTLERMKAHRRELWTPTIEKYNGRVVGTAGDSLLIEYASAVAAVESAIAVQEGMTAREAEIPEERKMRLRIGINIGEVIVDDDDIYGDGVNVAARLQEIAEPGGVSIARNVMEQVSGKLQVTFEDEGAQTVKNIAEPIHVWTWSTAPVEGNRGAPLSKDPLPLPEKPSIAVLPFDNMSGDPEQEFFSDGISEDIITALSKVHWLFVIARNSTFTYKGAAVDVIRVARELGVRYVVEGSVRKAGNKVRITAQLVDGTTGNHVWAERYDRELDDIFALQDEITETIVGRIDTELRASEIDRARRKPPANLDAWELYQRGLWHVQKITKEDVEEARTLFQKATESDPSFALAHAGIAATCFQEVFQDFGADPAERLAQGLAAGEQAVVLDDKDGFAHYALGRLLHLAGQGDRAIAELEKAVVHNPSFAHGYLGLGQALNWRGRAADGIRMVDMAMRLSPQDPILWAMQNIRSTCCNNLGNYKEAVEWARKAINARADQFWPRLHLARALAEQDRLDEARVAIEEARRLKTDLSLSVIRRLLPHYHPEYLERSIDGLRKAGLPE